MINSLDLDQTKNMFLYVADRIIESKSLLTELDSQIGDGDHGIGMSIGFMKTHEELAAINPSTINEIFNLIGMSMIKSMGGASGVIFGTMFIGGVKGLNPVTKLDLTTFAKIFERSLEAIKERGKAQVGDKTMIDALEPAVLSLKESADSSKDLLEGFGLAEEAAKKGMEDTKKYIANFGRAKSLGDRAIGHQDAGATSVWIIIRSIKEWLQMDRMGKNE